MIYKQGRQFLSRFHSFYHLRDSLNIFPKHLPNMIHLISHRHQENRQPENKTIQWQYILIKKRIREHEKPNKKRKHIRNSRSQPRMCTLGKNLNLQLNTAINIPTFVAFPFLQREPFHCQVAFVSIFGSFHSSRRILYK
jgi:hypothetical protein